MLQQYHESNNQVSISKIQEFNNTRLVLITSPKSRATPVFLRTAHFRR